MREVTRRYARRIVDALKHLNDWVRLLGAHGPAWVGRSWSNRDHLFRQGGRWIGRHLLAVSAALVAVAVLWAIGRVDWPDAIFSWAFWTTKPEDVRTLLFVSLGAIAAAIGLALAAVRTHAANLQARAANLQARVVEQGHITDRFTKAIEQLGNDKLEVRLGATYALERIARDSRRDHWPIMETLTAYVRENAPWPPKGDTEALEELLAAHIPVGGDPSGKPVAEEDPSRAKPRTDIQAILTVLGRRNRQHDGEGERLNLNGTCLRRANLVGAHLERADLARAHLEGADLARAHLERAFLREAHLEGAFLAGAHLEGAFLERAHLERAFLAGAHLERADLAGAHLERADLAGAHLEGADLARAHDLTQEQLAGAYRDEGTKLPESITTPLADAAGR